MDLKKQFGTNKKQELEGVWTDIGDGAQLLVARFGNKNYKDAAKRLGAPYKAVIRAGNLKDEVSDKLTTEALAEGVLLGWKGLKDDGKAVTYSKDEAIRLMTEYPDFRDQVLSLSTSIELFQSQEEAEVIKN
ncbi:MAG: hypothetical protein ACAH12_03600 [Methylophilaceae bacterium]